MLIRFGFVAMSTILENASPSKTVTLKTYKKLHQQDPEAAIAKLRRTARQNLHNSLRLLRHCKAHGIKVYRFSSKLIPLATHHELTHWEYIGDLESDLAELGRFIKENKMRASFHPDHFTLINSPKEEVFNSSVMDLNHHCRILEAMKLDEAAKLVMHVGGGYGNKERSLKRFVSNWVRIPDNIKKRIILENDDKTFTACETLYLCEKLELPMVLDIHHFNCNHEENSIVIDVYPRFLSTWEKTNLPPKIHVSSPKSELDFRSHHDYIDADSLYPLLMNFRNYNEDVDVMVEAKMKDKAMFKLVKELGKMPNIRLINEAALEII